MDIEILLVLQEFRNNAGAILTDFMSKMTFFGELNTTMVIMAVIYWCISKKLGTYMLMGWSGNRLLNGVLKVTVCAYRPWIRDPRIIPYGDSMKTATGYSFPSGHTMNSSTVFGSGITDKKAPALLRILLFLFLFLVGFSRLFLGVHTPQDVLIGAIAGLIVMWLTAKLMVWLNDHPDKDLLVGCIAAVLAIELAFYAQFKSYPVDFDASGNLIVDGMKMANDTFKAVGWCCAFFSGWLLERRYVRFSTDVSFETKLLRCVLGLLLYYVVSLILMPVIKTYITGAAGTIISCFLQIFYITFIFPWCMKHIEKQ